MSPRRVLIVGGGLVGLSCAYELATRGVTVTLVDPAPALGATRAAAGMLGAVSETHFGETDHAPLLLSAAAAWPAFAAAIVAASGIDIAFHASGTLLCGVTQSDRVEMDRLAALHLNLGLETREVNRSELRTIEPSLSARITRAHLVSSDHQVDGRATAGALQAIVRRLGACFVPQSVISIAPQPSGVTVTDNVGHTYEVDHVVVAAGSKVNSIEGLNRDLVPKVRPVKGEILRLFDPQRSLRHVIRAMVAGRSVYLVPRPNGEVVLGATSFENSDDETVRAVAVFELLSDARSVFPGLDELSFMEASAGLRPARDSGNPFIARDGDHITVLGGHNRNGILLSPITAAVAAGLILEGAHPQADLFEVLT